MKTNTQSERIGIQLKPDLLDFLDSFEDNAKRTLSFGYNDPWTRPAVAKLAVRYFKNQVERFFPLLEEGFSLQDAERKYHARRAWWNSASPKQTFEPGHSAEIIPFSLEGIK